MSNKLIAFLAVIAAIVVVMAGLTFYRNQAMTVQNGMLNSANDTQMQTGMNMVADNSSTNHDYSKNIVKPRPGQPIKKFVLTAQETNIRIKDGVSTAAWTYNGTVPGQEIRVIQGDFVQVELKNTLKDPVTIHWHGYPLNTAMDGVPGLNQDAVRHGETFTYEISADVSGTYWYHSHQEGSKQVDKGLYGALIVEPKDKAKPDRDYTLILDEWMENPVDMDSMSQDNESNSGHDGMNMGSETNSNQSIEGMDMNSDTSSHGGMNMDSAQNTDPVMAEEEMMAYMYDIYTVNGESGNLITPLEAKKGEVVRLRFINAGYRSHGIHIPGQDVKVVSTDGQDINGPSIIKDQIIMIAPGERYDVEFTVTSDESFIIDAHDDNAYNDQISIPFKVIDGNGRFMTEKAVDEYVNFDITSYGKPGSGQFSVTQNYDIYYKVELNTRVKDKKLEYTINGMTFKELPPLKLKTGNTVMLTFKNNSAVDHPMHLHGHFFQVLSKNGVPLSGSNVTKDTLLMKPGEEYVVAFKADNTGRWVQHCHELHHAAAGMMQTIEYTDYNSNYLSNPNNSFNKPE